MKKILIVAIGILVFLTGCGGGSKTVITSDDFITSMSNEGFTVSSNGDSYSDSDYIIDARIAVLDDISIEMITYDTADNAQKVLETHIESSQARKSTAASEQKQKGENYYRYSLASNGYYIVSSRVDNTLIFCITNLDSKEKVDSAFEALGY